MKRIMLAIATSVLIMNAFAFYDFEYISMRDIMCDFAKDMATDIEGSSCHCVTMYDASPISDISWDGTVYITYYKDNKIYLVRAKTIAVKLCGDMCLIGLEQIDEKSDDLPSNLYFNYLMREHYSFNHLIRWWI